MKAGCDDFFKTVVKIVMTTVGWTQNFKNLSVEEMSGEIRNWQVMLAPHVDNCLLFSISFGMFPT